MWKQGGSSALERAQALLSSHSTPRPVPSALMLTEESDLSESSLGSLPGHMDLRKAGTPGSKRPTGLGASEQVAQHSTPLDSRAVKFLKRLSTASDQPKESRAVSSTPRTSQAVALSKLAQIENRFGRSLYIRSPHEVGQKRQTEGQAVLPNSDRGFGGAPARDAILGRASRPSEHSTQSNRIMPLSPSPVPPQSSLSPSSPSSLPSVPLSPPSPPSPPSPLSPLSPPSPRGDSVDKSLPLEDADSDRSSTSGNFRINVMNLDDLGPAALLLEEQPSRKEPNSQEEEVEEELCEEGALEEAEDEDYPSDFESVIETVSLSGYSQDSGQPPSPRSPSSYSNIISRAGTSDPLPEPSSLSDDPQPDSHSHDPLPQPSSPLAPRDTAPDDPLPQARSLPAPRGTAGHTFHLPAAQCVCCPSLGPLLESLRQQLTLTSHFVRRAQEQHAQVLEGLGPPDYRYITLEDTLKHMSGLLGSSSQQRTHRR